ncbi:hypothetical protein GCM10010232_49030 [Streptomyces amakusaensis]|uniref:HTH cro/C1-type domain-containing protein n=1 Tax=Streptomyces amakusaensis TaxID=67271 RepID=A0ABW0AKZ4_9ACTN
MTAHPTGTQPGPETAGSRAPVVLTLGDGMPHRHPGTLVLGASLRQRRLARRLSAGDVARRVGGGLRGGRLERMEAGHAPLSVAAALAVARAVGIGDKARLAVVADLAEYSEPSFTDGRPGARERLLGVEAIAAEIVAVALGPLWPAQWAWDPPVPPSAGRPEPRPWPDALTTLVLQDRLLDQRLGCPALAAMRLTALADRAEATALDVRIAPFLSRELTHLASALGALGSRITLTGGRTLYVTEGYDPVYRAPGSTTRAAMNDLLDATVRGPDAVAALRAAAQEHTAAACERAGIGLAVAGCRCPATPDAPRGRPAKETVVAVVRHMHDVLLVPGPQGLRPPLTVRTERETVAQAAARAVWEQTGYAAVVTHHLDTPAGTPRHVLCTVPGAQEQHNLGAEWAPADAAPGLPPLPPAGYDYDEHGGGGT